MKEKYINELELSIYNTGYNIYGLSNYLDVNFVIKNGILKAISGTSCKYGEFEDLCKEKLNHISNIVNKSLDIREVI